MWSLIMRRRGFTLIELLVVIAIIAVLMGLLMAGVMAVLQAKDRTANAYDINKLDQSMSAATKQYANSKTLPGYIVLCNNMDVYRNPANYASIIPKNVTQLDLDRSKATLRKMFGERFVTNGQVVDWDNSFATTAKKIPGIGDPNSILVLEGHQCLVFYLGGIADSGTVANPVIPPSMTGFASDPLNPTLPANSGLPGSAPGDRIGPFYSFERPRLETILFATSVRFPAYKDRYGTPYAYYGGTGGANSYVGGCPSLVPSSGNKTVPGLLPVVTCPSGYLDTGVKFMKPDSVQIISAGKNKAFGDPLLWSPSSGSTDGNARDDVSNFSAYALTNPAS